MKIQQRRLTRRELLAGAAGAALAGPLIVPAHVLGRGSTPPPSERITMGLIGAGGMGRAHLRGRANRGEPGFLSQQDVQFLAVCDVDGQRAGIGRRIVNNFYENEDCAAYRDFRELVARDDLDAVLVATPDHWHALTALAAVRAGKDVYCEKPLTHTHEEGVAVVNAVRKHRAIWQTGAQQRSAHPHWDFLRAVELVRNGVLGQLEHVETGLPVFQPESPEPSPQDPPNHLDYDFYCGPAEKIPYDPGMRWRWRLNFGGGALMDWINHHHDIAHWGMDMDDSGPIEVEAQGEFPPDGALFDTPYHFTVNCRYPNGVTASISDSNPRGVRFTGANGWLYVNRNTLEASDPAWTDPGFAPGPFRVYRSTEHHRNFLDCVKSREETVCPPGVAHRSCTPGFLAYASMFSGRKLRWDPAKELIRNNGKAGQHPLMHFNPRGDWKLEAQA